MGEFFTALLNHVGDYFLVLLKYIVRLITITLGTLGVVYLLGRMLSIEVSIKAKNITASVLLFLLSGIITFLYYSNSSITQMIWETFIFGAIAAVLYVIFAWRLFDRMDNFLDKKLGKDD